MPLRFAMTPDVVSLVNSADAVNTVQDRINEAVDRIDKKIDNNAVQAKKHDRINRRVGQRKSLREYKIKWR